MRKEFNEPEPYILSETSSVNIERDNLANIGREIQTNLPSHKKINVPE